MRETAATYTINQTVEVTHLAAALVDEEGVFEVTSPQGNIFEVTCSRRCRMSFREICDGKRMRRTNGISWRIRRLDRAAESGHLTEAACQEFPLQHHNYRPSLCFHSRQARP
jgi:hypothetical protein